MIFKAVFEKEAADELNCILEHIAVQLCNPAAAKSLFDAIQKAIDDVKRFPYGFPL